MLRGLAIFTIFATVRCSFGACHGSNVSACRCLLACKVLGENPAACDTGDMEETVREAVHVALNKQDNMTECKTVACIANCSRRAGCFRKEIRERCLAMKNESQVCDINCDEHGGAFAPMVTTVLLLAGAVMLVNSL